jgi:hypothetical protein
LMKLLTKLKTRERIDRRKQYLFLKWWANKAKKWKFLFLYG